MNNIEYKSIKKVLGFKNPDIWCAYFHITKDQDKSYSNGRTAIPEVLAAEIYKEKTERKEKVLELYEVFQSKNLSKIKSCELNESTNNIELKIDNSSIIFLNEGKDWLCHDLYTFRYQGYSGVIIYRKKKWVLWFDMKKEDKYQRQKGGRLLEICRDFNEKLLEEIFNLKSKSC